MKFKVGDKVKVLVSMCVDIKRHPEGIIGTITKIEDDTIRVYAGGIDWWYEDYELEVVSMERLTTRNSEGVPVFKQPYECDRCQEPLYRLSDLGNGSPTDKLCEYEDAEEQGLLLRLPCKVGDTVYKSCGEQPIAEFIVSHIYIIDSNIKFAVKSTRNTGATYWYYNLEDVGKTVFLTKEEAEQALAKMQQ